MKNNALDPQRVQNALRMMGAGDFALKDLFVYTWSVTGLAQNGTDNDTTTILAEADFVGVMGVGHAFNSSSLANIDYPSVTIKIFDEGAGRNLQDSATPLRTFFGHPSYPVIFPIPKLYSANSAVTVSFTELGGATTINLYLAMLGFKAWRK